MTRKILIKSDQLPYHIVNRSNDGLPFPVALNICWKVFCKYLESESEKRGVRIHAFVLMPNHFHLLASTPHMNIDEFMRDFQTKTSKELSLLAGGNGHRFESRYKWSLVTLEDYYFNCVRYVYQNPIRAKLVQELRDYRFSTFHSACMENSKDLLKIESSIFNFEKQPSHPHWLLFILTPLKALSINVIRRALKKKVCKFSYHELEGYERRQEVNKDLEFDAGARAKELGTF